MFTRSVIIRLKHQSTVFGVSKCFRYPLINNATEVSIRHVHSTNDSNSDSNLNTNDEVTEHSQKKQIYEGRYWKSLRRIRRVSLASCLTGIVVVVSDLCVTFLYVYLYMYAVIIL